MSALKTIEWSLTENYARHNNRRLDSECQQHASSPIRSFSLTDYVLLNCLSYSHLVKEENVLRYCVMLFQTTFGNNTNNICEAENKQLASFLTSSTRLSTAIAGILQHNSKLDAERKRVVFHETCCSTVHSSLPAELTALYDR